MFFDQLNERNAMVKSFLAFDEVGQVGLADFSTQKVIFFTQLPNAMIRVSFLAMLTI